MKKAKEFKINYGSRLQVALGKDIEIFRYKSIYDCWDKLESIINSKDESTIYLFTYDYPIIDNNQIIVTKTIHPILDLIKKHRKECTFPAIDDYNFYIQEYESWEDAYAVALMMREGSDICYKS